MSPDVLLLVSRLLIGFLFLGSGIGKIKGDQEAKDAIEGLGLPAPVLLEKLTGIFLVIGSLGLMLGIETKVAAILLATFVVVVTPLLLRFWRVENSAVRSKMMQGFVSNLAIIGGMFALVAAGPGSIVMLPGS